MAVELQPMGAKGPEDPVTPSKQARRTNSIEEELSFENIVNNRCLSPCSLNDFMDYLVFVEHDAECLQFFLWYIDYAERWSRLLPRQRFLSPRWDPLVDKSVDKDVDDYASSPEFLAELRKLDNVLAIMEETHKEAESARASRVSSRHASKSSLGNFTFGHHSRRSSEVANSHILHSSISGDLGTIDSAEDSEWQPFTIQPFRDELTRLVRHYLSPGAPRQLRVAVLPPHQRQACLRAVQRTTHPSALLPAFLACDKALRAGAYVRFVGATADRSSSRRRRLRHFIGGGGGYCVTNAQPARLNLVTALGIVLFSLGVALDVTLIVLGLRPRPSPVWSPPSPSSATSSTTMAVPTMDALAHGSPFLRLFCALLWWPGISLVICAAVGRICPLLWARGHRRQLPVWQRQTSATGMGYVSATDDVEAACTAGTTPRPSLEATVPTRDSTSSHISAAPHRPGRGMHRYSYSYSSQDPLRRPSMQAFGPRNEPALFLLNGGPRRPEPSFSPLSSAVAASSVMSLPMWSQHRTEPEDQNTGTRTRPGGGLRHLIREALCGEEAGTPCGAVRALQDTAVLRAVLWASLATIVLCVASVLVPTAPQPSR